MKIALFATCVNDTLFPGTGKAVVRILERLGHEVVFPEAQTCCGQMHLNTGYPEQALPLVRSFTDTFEEYDAIVAPSGSCAAMVRDWHGKTAARQGDHRLAERAFALTPRVHELAELLVDVLGVTDVGAVFPHRVTYHPTCHGLRMLKLGDKPLQLLREVRGIDLVDLPDATECCGFGGTFALKNADVSAAMCADKTAAVKQTRAEVLCAVDNSCLMHIGGTLSRQRSGVRVMHLAEILASDR
ncbi:L-lactate dehydrogenase complex protein LldE [Actinocorallia herbida]|uniref:L-lactate dehydrogenase complex protein LldE n=1 Tax=Actinocorallia herbida TaxID=58109 RepID=A0A3N1D0F2_9ACTN|nr:(Fe-S)-binding protein [Actinocorallia herbida]ROO86518.1 L-lactate dehydrogenase complex protein LldE [Actinocorallia herbida]